MSIYLESLNPDGIECETCGPSYDEAYIDYDGETRRWEFRGSWGCYGGEHYSGTRDEMIEWLTTEFTSAWGHLFTKDSIQDAVTALEAA